MPELNPDGTVYEVSPAPGDPETAHLDAQAIANCTLCDSDGYTGSRVVCDHTDHAPAAARGRELMADVLADIRRRKVNRVRGVSE